MRGPFRVEVYVEVANQWYCNFRYFQYGGAACNLAEEWAFRYALKTRVIDVRANEIVKEFDGRCN